MAQMNWNQWSLLNIFFQKFRIFVFYFRYFFQGLQISPNYHLVKFPRLYYFKVFIYKTGFRIAVQSRKTESLY